MTFLVRWGQPQEPREPRQPPPDFRLSSRSGMSLEVRRQVDHDLSIERGRQLILEARIRTVGFAGELATVQVARVRQVVELAARYCPEERHELDAIASAVAATQVRLVTESGQ